MGMSKNDIKALKIADEIRMADNKSIYNIQIKMSNKDDEIYLDDNNLPLKIYYVPKRYYMMLKNALQDKREELGKSINVALDLVNGVKMDTLDNFAPKRETNEQRMTRLKYEKKAREAKKRRIKNESKRNNKFNRSKEKKGKKIRNIIIALGIGGIAINVAAHEISKANADSKEYEYVASTVENLSENEIAQRAEVMLKEEISKATGEKIEDISFSDTWSDSSSHIAIIEAGDQEYRYLEDLRGGDLLGSNTMSRNLYNLVLEMNNVKGKDRKEVIEALKKSMNFCKNKDIEVKDGKLVEVEESTADSVEKDGEER